MSADKQAIIRALIKSLQEDLDHAVKASKDAAAYATDGESKAESKWDTQGIEASYLAAGQASHARDLAQYIDQLRRLAVDISELSLFVETGSFITIEANGESNSYFICPVGGGKTIYLGSETITIINNQSPLAQSLRGKTNNAQFRLPNGSPAKLIDLN